MVVPTDAPTVSTAPPTPAPTVATTAGPFDGVCADTPSYIDNFGYRCVDWRTANLDCNTASDLGYDEDAKAVLIASCPVTCGRCVPVTAAPQASTTAPSPGPTAAPATAMPSPSPTPAPTTGAPTTGMPTTGTPLTSAPTAAQPCGDDAGASTCSYYLGLGYCTSNVDWQAQFATAACRFSCGLCEQASSTPSTATPSTAPTTQPSQCADSATFRDRNGFRCSNWVPIDCGTYPAALGFSEAETEALLGACPQACDICVSDGDGAIVVPPGPTNSATQNPECFDMVDFTDAFGNRCPDWASDSLDCSLAQDYGYSAAQAEQIVANCEYSCGFCSIVHQIINTPAPALETTLAPETPAPTVILTPPPVHGWPSHSPTTPLPTVAPTASPGSSVPTASPASSSPSWGPSVTPTMVTTLAPTANPTEGPTEAPPCFNVYNGCQALLTSCFNPVYEAWMAINCRVTCELCAPQGNETRPTDPPSAFDDGQPNWQIITTTAAPTAVPTARWWSASPTNSEPTMQPTAAPVSTDPTGLPTNSEPTMQPTAAPVTSEPTDAPTRSPASGEPTAPPSTSGPTPRPTQSPASTGPSAVPTQSTTSSGPSAGPTPLPSRSPASSRPTVAPLKSPTDSPVNSAPSTVPTLSPTSSQPTPAPTEASASDAPTNSPTAVTTVPQLSTRAVPVTAALFAPAAAVTESTHQTSVPVIMTGAPGSTVDIASDWGPFSETTRLTTPREAAVNVNILLVDDEIDTQSSTVRVYCMMTDAGFSPRVEPSQSQCHVAVVASDGSTIQQQRCAANRQTGVCSMTYDIQSTPSLGNLTIKYGLNATMVFGHTQSVMVHPSFQQAEELRLADSQPALTDTLVLVAPARQVFPGEVFEVEINGRGTETISYAKFAVDVTGGGNVLEIVEDSHQSSSTDTWTISPAERIGGLQMFIIVKKAADSCDSGSSPCYVSQPGDQAPQPVLSIRLRVADTYDGDDTAARVVLRIYEFSVGINPEVPPGGREIVPVERGGRGWAHGCVIGRGIIYRNRMGTIGVRSNRPVGMFARLSSGHGTYFNLAPLTNESSILGVTAVAIYPYGLIMRSITAADLTCIAIDSAAVSIAQDCSIRFSPHHIIGSPRFNIAIMYQTLTSTSISVQIFAPQLPLAISVSSPVLGQLFLSEMEPFMTEGCTRSRMATARIAVETTFSNTADTTRVVDVTNLVQPYIVSSNPAVATVDATTATVTGATDGTTLISFGNVVFGTIAVTVNSSVRWFLQRLAVHHYADMTLTSQASGTVTTELVSPGINRAGENGAHTLVSWAEFALQATPSNTMKMPLFQSTNISYTVDSFSSSAVTITELTAQIIASESGNATVVGHWLPPCTALAIESASRVTVTLPQPDAVWLSNGQNTNRLSLSTIAHSDDAASLSGAVPRSYQRLGLVVDYGVYTESWFGVNDSVTYVIGSPRGYNSDIVTASGCPGGEGTCVFPADGRSGTVVIYAYKGSAEPSNSSLIAEITLTVVKANVLSVLAYPNPAYQSSPSPVILLRPYGDAAQTGVFQQATLSATLLLSDGTFQDVSTHSRQAYQTSNQDQLMLNGRVVSVSGAGVGNGVSTIIAMFPGRDGNATQHLFSEIVIGVDRSVNPLVGISDVRVYRSLTSRGNLGNPATLYKTQNSTFNTVFSAHFSDGSIIQTSAMGRDTFGLSFLGSGLFSFASTDPSGASIDGHGVVTVHENRLAPVVFSAAASANADILGTSDPHFVNLRARSYEIDIASSSGAIGIGPPLSYPSGDTVSVELYLTTGDVSLGALEVALQYDPAVLTFVTATGGSDFNQNFGSDASRAPGVVDLGGVTTAYLSGSNLHIATVTFTVTDRTAGDAAFSGHIMSAADRDGNNQNPHVPQTPFSFGSVGTARMPLQLNRNRREGSAIFRQGAPRMAPMARRTAGTCTVGRGPYPIGDTNGDCKFDTTDALVAAQFLLISSNGANAIRAFFDQKHAAGIIQGGLESDVMDVDFNRQVMVSDVQHMIFVKYNSRRFTNVVVLSCGTATGSTLTSRVERANAQTHPTDPADRNNTRVYFIITGELPSEGATASALTSQFGEAFSVSEGRFRGVLPTAESDVPGVYAAGFEPLGMSYGASIIHLVRKEPAGWIYGYFSAGDPQDIENKIENEAMDLSPTLTIVDQGSATAMTVPLQFRFGPMVQLEACATGAPTLASVVSPPTLGPTQSSTTVSPTLTPSTGPTRASFNPTPAPSGLPTPGPTQSSTTVLPTLTPSTGPTRASFNPTVTEPTPAPTPAPTTSEPSASPSPAPTTSAPAALPSLELTTPEPNPSPPTMEPSPLPSRAADPSLSPSTGPVTPESDSTPAAPTSPSSPTVDSICSNSPCHNNATCVLDYGYDANGDSGGNGDADTEPLPAVSFNCICAPGYYGRLCNETDVVSLLTTAPTTAAQPSPQPSLASFAPTTFDPTPAPSSVPVSSEPTPAPSPQPSTFDPTPALTLIPTSSEPTAFPITLTPTVEPTVSPATIELPAATPSPSIRSRRPTQSPSGVPTFVATPTPPEIEVIVTLSFPFSDVIVAIVEDATSARVEATIGLPVSCECVLLSTGSRRSDESTLACSLSFAPTVTAAQIVIHGESLIAAATSDEFTIVAQASSGMWNVATSVTVTTEVRSTTVATTMAHTGAEESGDGSGEDHDDLRTSPTAPSLSTSLQPSAVSTITTSQSSTSTGEIPTVQPSATPTTLVTSLAPSTSESTAVPPSVTSSVLPASTLTPLATLPSQSSTSTGEIPTVQPSATPTTLVTSLSPSTSESTAVPPSVTSSVLPASTLTPLTTLPASTTLSWPGSLAIAEPGLIRVTDDIMKVLVTYSVPEHNSRYLIHVQVVLPANRYESSPATFRTTVALSDRANTATVLLHTNGFVLAAGTLTNAYVQAQLLDLNALADPDLDGVLATSERGDLTLRSMTTPIPTTEEAETAGPIYIGSVRVMAYPSRTVFIRFNVDATSIDRAVWVTALNHYLTSRFDLSEDAIDAIRLYSGSLLAVVTLDTAENANRLNAALTGILVDLAIDGQTALGMMVGYDSVAQNANTMTTLPSGVHLAADDGAKEDDSAMSSQDWIYAAGFAALVGAVVVIFAILYVKRIRARRPRRLVPGADGKIRLQNGDSDFFEFDTDTKFGGNLSTRGLSEGAASIPVKKLQNTQMTRSSTTDSTREADWEAYLRLAKSNMQEGASPISPGTPSLGMLLSPLDTPRRPSGSIEQLVSPTGTDISETMLWSSSNEDAERINGYAMAGMVEDLPQEGYEVAGHPDNVGVVAQNAGVLSPVDEDELAAPLYDIAANVLSRSSWMGGWESPPLDDADAGHTDFKVSLQESRLSEAMTTASSSGSAPPYTIARPSESRLHNAVPSTTSSVGFVLATTGITTKADHTNFLKDYAAVFKDGTHTEASGRLAEAKPSTTSTVDDLLADVGVVTTNDHADLEEEYQRFFADGGFEDEAGSDQNTAAAAATDKHPLHAKRPLVTSSVESSPEPGPASPKYLSTPSTTATMGLKAGLISHQQFYAMANVLHGVAQGKLALRKTAGDVAADDANNNPRGDSPEPASQQSLAMQVARSAVQKKAEADERAAEDALHAERRATEESTMAARHAKEEAELSAKAAALTKQLAERKAAEELRKLEEARKKRSALRPVIREFINMVRENFGEPDVLTLDQVMNMCLQNDLERPGWFLDSDEWKLGGGMLYKMPTDDDDNRQFELVARIAKAYGNIKTVTVEQVTTMCSESGLERPDWFVDGEEWQLDNGNLKVPKSAQLMRISGFIRKVRETYGGLRDLSTEQVNALFPTVRQDWFLDSEEWLISADLYSVPKDDADMEDDAQLADMLAKLPPRFEVELGTEHTEARINDMEFDFAWN